MISTHTSSWGHVLVCSETSGPLTANKVFAAEMDRSTPLVRVNKRERRSYSVQTSGGRVTTEKYQVGIVKI